MHVFEGTGVGKVGNRSVGWFGRVVGRDGDTYLVRNRLLAERGSPTRVEGHFLKYGKEDKAEAKRELPRCKQEVCNTGQVARELVIKYSPKFPFQKKRMMKVMMQGQL